MAELKPWQQASEALLLKWFRDERAQIALDSSDTGTGKTYVAAKLLADWGTKALVICPKSSKTNWRRVVGEFGAGPQLLDVRNPESLKTGKSPWWQGGRWTMPPGSMILWDEVHRGASGAKSEQTKMLALTKAFGIPTLAMSATLADSPLKLRAIGYLMGLHPYNTAGFYSWCLANGCRRSPYHSGLEFSKGTKGQLAMLDIHQRMKARMVRIKLSEVPDFPEGLVEAELFDIDSKYEEDQLNELWEQMSAQIKEQGANPLTQSLRARQRTEWLKVPIMSELTTEIVEEGKSAVCFINFTESQEALRERLSKYQPVMIHGDQTETERQAAMDSFQNNDSVVCICKIQAGGISINLHDVKQERMRVTLISPSWSASELRQALGRIRRTGGTRAVQKIILLANTVEEKVYQSLQRKLGNMDTLNDGDLTPT